MPEWGYWSEKGSWPYYASVIGTNETRPSYLLPETSRVLEQFTDLWRDGLLFVKNDFTLRTPEFTEFPTALVYFYDLFYPNAIFAERTGFDRLDFSGYRVYAMYGGIQPVAENAEDDYWYVYGGNAVAGKGTDASEFLKFMEWLGIQENYTLLLYGVEGLDYILTNGKITPLESTAAMMADVRYDLNFLERSDFMAVPPNAPWNFADEMRSLEPAYTISFSAGDKTSRGAFAEDYGDGYRAVINASDEMTMMFDDLFNNDTTAPGLDEARDIIGGFIERQKDRKDILDMYAEAAEKALNAASDQ
jgi:hypothetical protein